MKTFILWITLAFLGFASLLVASTTVPTTTYNAGQSVTVTDASTIQTGSGSTVTVGTGSYISYQAGTSVTLNPGFTAQSGSYFDAFINTGLTPTLPTDLTATSQSTNYIDLLWSPSTDIAGVKSYQIYRSTTSGVTGSQIGTSTLPTFDDTSVSGTTTYYYSIVAVDAVGQQSSTSAQLAVSAMASVGSENVNLLLGTSTGTNTTVSASTLSFLILQPQ